MSLLLVIDAHTSLGGGGGVVRFSFFVNKML
jgi:hypothetical protein